jgi:hypothetical protein
MTICDVQYIRGQSFLVIHPFSKKIARRYTPAGKNFSI